MLETDYADIFTDPYDCNDPANEPRPASVIYDPNFRELQKFNKLAASLLREPLVTSRFSNVITEGLKKEITKRTKEDFPDQVKFAVVGDMKAGKSSVINSILSIGTIARKGDGGDSCTWVVQRYMKMFPDQSSSFAAKVRFFDGEEIRNVLEGLLAKYYRANKNDKEGDEDGEDDEDSLKVESFGDMRDTVTAFMALFCDKEEFETEESAHNTLRTAKFENDPVVLDVLVEWAENIINVRLEGKRAVLVEESTPDDLLWKLQPYTYQVGGLEGHGVIAPWPLVSAIDFGLDHPLLNEGIVFVDSPGLSDANSSRSRNAINSHRECTHKIAVAEIGRAEADTALRRNLQSGSRTRGSGHMMLVLTHGDTIDPSTEVSGTPIEKKRVAQLDGELKTLRAQKQKTQQEMSRVKVEHRDDLAEEIRSLASQIRKFSQERDDCRLEMRNRKVVVKMQDIYKGLTSDPRPLAAFAVGNEVYQQYMAGFAGEDRPFMSVKQTNVPALRRKLYTMPIEGRLNDTMHLAETQLPNLVNTIELYCAQLHLARQGEIEAMVLAPKKLLRDVVRDSLEGLKNEVVETILTPMKYEENNWNKEARKCCREWTAKFNGQLPILKSNGFKKGTKGRNGGKDTDWNLQLLNIGGDTLDSLFQDFTKKTATSWAKNLAEGLVKLCDDARKEIKRDRQFHTLALEPFFNSFHGESRNLARLVRESARKLERDIGNILERASSQSDDDFVATAMVPIYREAVQIKGGRGAPGRRAGFIESKVSKRNGLWIKVHDAIDEAFDKQFRKADNAMVAQFGDVFDTLHNNFRLLCDKTEAKDDKEKVLEEALRNELKGNLVLVKKMLDEGGEICRLVAWCKAYGVQPASASPMVLPQ